VILVSSTYEIVTVLRTFRPHVPEGENPSRFQVYEVGAIYVPLERHSSDPTTFETFTREQLEGMLRDTSLAQDEVEEEEVNALLTQGHAEMGTKKKPKKKKEIKYTLRRTLVNGAADYGAQLVEQIIRSSGIDGNKLVNQIPQNGTFSLFIDMR
jgi:hypothetical protein